MHIFSYINKPFLALVAAALLLVSVQQSYAATPDVKTIQPGVLTIGSDLTYPPYYFLKNGEPAGFGPQVMRALASHLNLEPKFEDTRFAQLIVGLKSHHFDVVASALYITPKRAQQVDYVPVFQTGDSLVAPKDGSFQPREPADLCGKKISVIKGASVIPKLQKTADKVCKNGKGIDIREFPTAPGATQALLAGAVDAQIVDAAVAPIVVDKAGAQLAITTDRLLYPVPVGLGVAKDDDALKKALEGALQEMKDSGEYQQLLDEYNLEPPAPALVEKALGHS